MSSNSQGTELVSDFEMKKKLNMFRQVHTPLTQTAPVQVISPHQPDNNGQEIIIQQVKSAQDNRLLIAIVANYGRSLLLSFSLL